MSLREDILGVVKGDVADDTETLHRFSRDTSIFERKPSLVVFPKDAKDVAKLVTYVAEAKAAGRDISLTGRSAGTDMSGGPLSDSIIVSFTKYMNHLLEIGPDYAITEPGVYYRDFEKQTLAKTGMVLPSYPASREICAMGGIVSNNSGGELTLRYGKTAAYVEELDVVLSDGSIATFGPVTKRQLAARKRKKGLEGTIYKKMDELLKKYGEEIAAARPQVSKNSAGYALWDIYDPKTETFNLAKLIVGSQGTLGLVTRAKLKLVKRKEYRAMLVVFLSDLKILPDIVHRVLTYEPESFESYDDNTFKLAVRFIPQLLGQLGFLRAIQLGLAFFPEVGMVLSGGVPKLVLMAEFAEDSVAAARAKAERAQHALQEFNLQTKVALGDIATSKYWTIRRESFALLRKNLSGYVAAPFIDDFVVDPNTFPSFLPELNALLEKYHLLYTIAGHVGNGNFHIIPLMNLAKPESRQTILELSPKVYELVTKYGGSTTGEHNDGIIRTPYLHMMFDENILKLFAETKSIFDPDNIFNPGKKVGGTQEDIAQYMLKTSV